MVTSGPRTSRRGSVSIFANTQEQVSFAPPTPAMAKGMEHADWSILGPVPLPLEEHGPRVGEISPQEGTRMLFLEEEGKMGTRQRYPAPNLL